MGNEQDRMDKRRRDVLAASIIGFAFLVILVVSVVALIKAKDPMVVMGALLPVIASWVGTVLAFYFGRENFEAANQQVRELVDRMTPEQRGRQPIRTIMRKYDDITKHQFAAGQTPANVTLQTLRQKFVGSVTRLLIVDSNDVALLMIHQSRFDRYIAGGKAETDTLQAFVDSEKAAGREFGPGKGFVVVGENTTLKDAAARMQSVDVCQDIVITANGEATQAVTGWVSNVRLASYVEA